MTTPLGRVRGLGSAKHGVGHWWIQRLTALALVPLSMWFMAGLLSVAQSADPFRVADWLSSPFHVLMTALFLITAFWHAKLGMQVVIEDYVHHPLLKYMALVANSFVCFACAAAGLLAILKLHLLDVVSGF